MTNRLRRFRLSQGAWAGLFAFALLVLLYRSALFAQPWHEHSDYAVNAIQIERSSHFQELHGNYSRFDFYHPGPAFFYLYALGERVFHRWLQWVPSPFNAHMLAGLMLQCFFFAAALVVAERWVRRPLFVPLALLLSMVHFGLAGNACISVWPPRTILMPLLCFVVGVASVAAGRLRDLPITVFAACMLSHGHVAQPSFVLPAFGVACASFWWSERQGSTAAPGAAPRRRIYLISAGCVLLALLPLALDAAAGYESNLARIVDFWRHNEATRKTLLRSFLYLCGWFGYVKKPELYLTATGPDRAELTGELIPAYFAWVGVIVVIAVYLAKLRRAPVTDERRFVFWLCAFIGLAIGFCLYWGRVQIGKMYEYNGYFYYAVLGAILFVFSARVSAITLPRPRLAAGVLYGATVLMIWLCWSDRLPIDYATNLFVARVDSALSADPSPAAKKYLIFGQNDWGEVASIALALKRKGMPFCSDAEWGPRLEAVGAYEPKPPAFEFRDVSVWRLSRVGPPDQGCLIRNDLRLYFSPLPLDPRDAVIDCGDRGNLGLYALFGFASPFGRAAWTNRPYAGLVLASPPANSDVIVAIAAEPYAAPGDAPEQPMTLQVNGRDVFHCTLCARGVVEARVPAEAWNAQNPVTVVLHLPRSVDLRRRGLSIERRVLGWHIEKISFRTAHPLNDAAPSAQYPVGPAGVRHVLRDK